MTLATIYDCFSGNTPDTIDSRCRQDLMVRIRGDFRTFKVSDFAMFTDGRICLFVEET